MDISVVIPTRNRPRLLKEAVQSVMSPAEPDVEIVIVDDASEPPVDVAQLHSDFGSGIRVIRNNVSVSVCVARDQGVLASRRELILHLDDDDRLAEGALNIARKPFQNDSALDVLFLGVQGFGQDADGFDRRQDRGMRRVLVNTGADAALGDLVKFDKTLFQTLLAGVPMAFQRVMVRRAAWNKVNNFRRRIYALSQPGAGRDPLFGVCPLWSESEWSMYASILCTTALLYSPLYLQRCAGQGYFSAGKTELESFNAGINIMNHLGRATRVAKEFAPWRRQVRERRSEVHLDRAHFFLERGDRIGAIQSVVRAFGITPDWKHFRFCAKIVGGAPNRGA